jgi:hypothetical protein
MAQLWIGNIAPGTSDDELKALLVKYGFPACDEIKQVPGDGSRPAVTVSFDATDALQLQQLQPRVHNLYWKERRLNVTVVSSAHWTK